MNVPQTPDDTWKPLGRLVAAIVADVEQAIRARDEAAAAEAHDDLLQVEHEQRTIETARKYAK